MVEITEQQIYAAFGLGEQMQELAAPAPETTEPAKTGEQVQEVAAPTEGTPDTGSEPQTEPGVEGADPKEGNDEAAEVTEPEKQPLTTEQRRANAARRRQQEEQSRQAAIDQAVQAAIQQERDNQENAMKDFFQKAGLKNTITGEPITNMEQFNAWNQQYSDAKLQRDLKAGKLTPEALASAISNHPVVKQAQQLIDQDTADKKAAAQAAAKANIEREIAEIHKLDGSIGSLEDLIAAPYWPQLYAKTKQGYSIKDAHFLLNYPRLEQAKLEAARQQGVNNAMSKNHMTPAAPSRGAGSVSVPAAEMAMFRQFNPNATDAEIQAYYNKYKKG